MIRDNCVPIIPRISNEESLHVAKALLKLQVVSKRYPLSTLDSLYAAIVRVISVTGSKA